jgi:hypothetical protein
MVLLPWPHQVVWGEVLAVVDLAAALALDLEQYQVRWAVVPALEVEEDQDHYSSRIEHCLASP